MSSVAWIERMADMDKEKVEEIFLSFFLYVGKNAGVGF